MKLDMFKDAFVLPKKTAPAQPHPNYVAPSQGVIGKDSPPLKQSAPVYEDPEIAKLKFLVLKWLTIAVGGGAVLLVVWRILLKFL